MKRTKLANLISAYFGLGVGAPLTGLPAALTINGALVDTGSLIQLLTQAVRAQIAGTSQQFATSAAATITLTALQNLIQRLTQGGATTVTIDSAYNIVNTIANPFVGQTFPLAITTNAATTVATPTLSDTAVTLSGTTAVLAASARFYQGQITQVVTTVGAPMTAGTTFTSLTQIGTTNNYTVALGTNALIPVVGTAVYLGVTAGTLPPGWYPINAVTSAVSFVIAAPLSAAAWTATAATVPGTILVPASQYTPGLAGVYSPMLTITGMWALVVSTASV